MVQWLIMPKRIKDHIGRFTKMYYQIKECNIDEEFLKIFQKRLYFS